MPDILSRYSVSRPQADGVGLVIATGTIQTQSQAHITTNIAATSAELNQDLPAPPEWFIGALLGSLAFGFVTAIVLYLANFPPDLLWLDHLLWQNHRRHGYGQVSTNDNGKDNFSKRYASSLGARSVRRRNKTKKLSIDTSANYGGLGIALPVESETGEVGNANGKRRSHDQEELRLYAQRAQSPTKAVWTALTSPLPQVTGFGTWSPAARRTAVEIENIAYPPSSNAFATEVFSPASPSHHFTDGVKGQQRSSGLLSKASGVIEHAAEHMSRVLYDQVENSPEDELLLPVRNCERQQGLDQD